MTSAAIPRVDVVISPSYGRVVAVMLSGVVVVAASAVAGVFLDLEARARCEAGRDQSGVGRAVALQALDAPESHRQFLYRVTSDGSGYRAVVVVKDGPFVGDAWERDAEGRIRHHSDVCRDTLLASLEDT